MYCHGWCLYLLLVSRTFVIAFLQLIDIFPLLREDSDIYCKTFAECLTLFDFIRIKDDCWTLIEIFSILIYLWNNVAELHSLDGFVNFNLFNQIMMIITLKNECFILIFLAIVSVSCKNFINNYFCRSSVYWSKKLCWLELSVYVKMIIDNILFCIVITANNWAMD